MFPDIFNAAKVLSQTEKDERKKDREYQLIFKEFKRLEFELENNAERLDILEDIITLRASFLIDHALTGLRIDFDRAISLLRDYNNFTNDREKQERDILVAAIENLIDFAAAEEYSMLTDIENLPKNEKNNKSVDVFDKYHLLYGIQENKDIEYAAVIAYWWLSIKEDTLVTLMTQGDERVRAWHLSHEGSTYSKNDFPPELIPPLEFGCRCFLITNSMSSVSGSLIANEKADSFNPIFRESLAKGGKIFSDAHPYFKKNLPENIELLKVKLKKKFNLL